MKNNRLSDNPEKMFATLALMVLLAVLTLFFSESVYAAPAELSESTSVKTEAQVCWTKWFQEECFLLEFESSSILTMEWSGAQPILFWHTKGEWEVRVDGAFLTTIPSRKFIVHSVNSSLDVSSDILPHFYKKSSGIIHDSGTLSLKEEFTPLTSMPLERVVVEIYYP